MKVLTERDLRRLAAAVRKSEQINFRSSLTRPPVLSGSGASIKLPTGRIEITAENTYLTAAEHENKLIYINETVMSENNLWLPPAPAVGDTYWFVIWMAANTYIRSVSRDHVIVAPMPEIPWGPSEYIAGYRFFPPSSPNCYLREALYFLPIGAVVNLTWCVMTYTGEVVQVPIDYVDIDGDGAYAVGHPFVYQPCTKWVVVRERSTKITHNTYLASDKPF